MATKRMSTADQLKSKRDEVYSTLLGRIPKEFMEVKRAMQRRFKGNGKLSSVGLPENIAFTIEAIQGASTQAELEQVQVLVKNDAFRSLPKTELKSQLLMAIRRGVVPDPTPVPASALEAEKRAKEKEKSTKIAIANTNRIYCYARARDDEGKKINDQLKLYQVELVDYKQDPYRYSEAEVKGDYSKDPVWIKVQRLFFETSEEIIEKSSEGKLDGTTHTFKTLLGSVMSGTPLQNLKAQKNKFEIDDQKKLESLAPLFGYIDTGNVYATSAQRTVLNPFLFAGPEPSMVLKSKYDKDMETEKKRYDILLDAYDKLENKLKERSTELEKCKQALTEAQNNGATAREQRSAINSLRKDYDAKIKTLRAELIAKSSAAGLQKQLEDKEKEIVKLKEQKGTTDEKFKNLQIDYVDALNKSEAAKRALTTAEASLSDNDTKAKAVLKECKDSVTALQEALKACETASTRQADESRSTQRKLEDNIRQLQEFAESKEQEAKEARQDKEERGRGRVTVMNTLPNGFSSLKALGIPKKDLYTMREFFLYARSTNRRQHILYEHTDGQFREDLKETTGTKNSIEFRVGDNEVFGYDEKEYKQGNDDIFVSNEFATYLFKPVYTLEKDQNREEVKLPETFKTLDTIRFSDDSDYLYANRFNVTRANTKIGHSDLFQFVEARASDVLVFVQRTDDKKWVPLKNIRKQISSKIPFTIGYNGKKGNTKVSKLANLSRIAVLEKEYLEWYDNKNPTVIDNGKRLGGRGEIATKDNTMIGTRISNEGTKRIFEISGFKKNSWSVKENKNTHPPYTGNYVIVSHPTGDSADSSSEDSSGSGGEESSEDEIEDGGENFQEIVRQRRQRNRPTGELSGSDSDDSEATTPLAKIQERMGQLPASGFKAGDVVRMKNQLYIVRGDGKGTPAKRNPTGDGYIVDIDKRRTKKLTSEAKLVLSGEDNEEKTNSLSRKRDQRRGLLEQPLRVVSYEGVAGEVPALPLLRIPEPHEL